MRSEVDPVELDAASEAANQPVQGLDSKTLDLETPTAKQSRIISAVLSPAIRLWIRTQLEQVEELKFAIESGDRQLLSGSINQVTVSARKAVYKGLCFSQVYVTGREIRTNLGQMIRRRQQFRLLEAFPISGEVLWCQADLNSSLQAPLLAGGITEFLLMLIRLGFDDQTDLEQRSPSEVSLQVPRIVVEPERLTLSATLLPVTGNSTNVTIRTGFALENGNQLRLQNPERLSHFGATEGVPLDHLDGVAFDLGSSVVIEHLALEAGQIRCRGQVTVTPEVA